MTANFVHLRTHSQYSLIDSVIDIDDLVKDTAKLGMPAVALTDHCNFFALIKFYKAAIAAGIKPIFGSDFTLAGEEGETSQVTLLAMNEKGYKNITGIISLAYLEGQVLGVPRIRWQWLQQYNDGIIALSGARFGNIGKALLNGNVEQATLLLQQWLALFPDRFYIELQRTGRAGDETYLHHAVRLAAGFNCPVVATNDVRFISADAFEAHETRVCIHEGEVLNNPRRQSRYSPQQYLRSPEEMASLFADIPSALENTVEIARRCSVMVRLGKYFLPEYPLPDEYKHLSHAEYFRQISHLGLTQRLEYLYDTSAPGFAGQEKVYRDRLDFELDIILQMGFSGYFLIVMEFIQWAKDNGVPVGPGRGSGAGSLVAYSLKITDLDPLEYDLLFERFLNPERVSMPDFDIDFCMIRRDEVIDHVKERYGHFAVSQIITFGTMAAKAVVRDVARVQGKSYRLADKLSKLIPKDPNIDLKKAFDEVEAIRDMLNTDPDAQEVWDMALQLEGTVRGVGKHAGGVVIAPTRLTDFSPIYCDEDGNNLVTQYDKGDVEEAGLVKFDFLGLRTLTIIDWTKRMVDRQRAAQGEGPLDIMAIPLDDPATYALLKHADTTAVFQVESRGMKDLIKKLSPDNIEDLIALLALFRPGPLDSGMVTDFVNRKHGRAKVAYPDEKYQHPSLKPILEPTYGVIVYQEQVMQIAQVLAGYSLGGADLLRRAMGKKNAEEMAKQRDSFRSGAMAKGVDPDLAMKIFDLVEKFAGYGFNKSHSAAYAIVSYQTAWLKAHYPAPFMAAVLSSELEDTDKIVVLIEECRRMGLPIINPDVNCAEFMFTVDDRGRIVYGLGAIKGLGEGPVESLVAARRAGGSFKNLFDFCERIDLRKVNKRALEALVKAGAFDSLGESRALLLAAIPEAVKAAEQQSQNAVAGMTDLFGAVDDGGPADVYTNFRHASEWSERERLVAEKEALGLYLTGHPVDEYRDELRRLNCKRLVSLAAEEAPQLVAGLVTDLREIRTKKGERMIIVTLDDNSGRIDVTIFSRLLAEVEARLAKDNILFIRGNVELDDYSGSLRMRAESVMDLAEIRSQGDSRIHISVSAAELTTVRQEQLHKLLANHGDRGCRVVIHYRSGRSRCRLELGPEWRVNPDEETIRQFRRCFGEKNVTLG